MSLQRRTFIAICFYVSVSYRSSLFYDTFYLIHLVIVVHNILIYLRYYQSLGGVIYQLLCMCLNIYSIYRYPS
jgi:hypothetical protein